MKSFAFALVALVAATAPLSAKTVKLPGIYAAEDVKSLCKRYGGSFSMTRKGHGCSRPGTGRVWCSAAGKCTAVYRDDLKIAQR
jgi:hypothetical protein